MLALTSSHSSSSPGVESNQNNVTCYDLYTFFFESFCFSHFLVTSPVRTTALVALNSWSEKFYLADGRVVMTV